MKDTPQAVCFDWDGTIFQSPELWYEATKNTYRVFGKDPIEREAFFEAVLGVYNGDFLAHYRRAGITAPDKDLDGTYHTFYGERMGLVRLYDDVIPTLLRIDSLGVPLHLITYSKEVNVVPMLKQLHVEKFFRSVHCDIINKTEVLLKISQRYKYQIERICMVADAPTDIRNARTCGAQAIFIDRGHFNKETLLKEPHDRFIDSLDQLLQ